MAFLLIVNEDHFICADRELGTIVLGLKVNEDHVFVLRVSGGETVF